MKLAAEVVVDRPRSEVFDYFADLERASEWALPVVERRKLSDGPIGVGTLFAAVDQFPGRKVEFTVEITAFEPHDRLAAAWSKPIEGGWDATFADVEGGTRLTLDAYANPSGAFKLLARTLKGWVEHQMKADLTTFKNRLEGGSAQTG